MSISDRLNLQGWWGKKIQQGKSLGNFLFWFIWFMGLVCTLGASGIAVAVIEGIVTARVEIANRATTAVRACIESGGSPQLEDVIKAVNKMTLVDCKDNPAVRIGMAYAPFTERCGDLILHLIVRGGGPKYWDFPSLTSHHLCLTNKSGLSSVEVQDVYSQILVKNKSYFVYQITRVVKEF